MKSKILSFLIATLVMFALPALAQSANTATITFSPSATYSDGTAYPTTALVTYELYQGVKGATKAKVGVFSSGGSITTGLLTGNEYCWDIVTVVRLVAGGTPSESAHSNEACKKFIGTPGTVTITVT